MTTRTVVCGTCFRNWLQKLFNFLWTVWTVVKVLLMLGILMKETEKSGDFCFPYPMHFALWTIFVLPCSFDLWETLPLILSPGVTGIMCSVWFVSILHDARIVYIFERKGNAVCPGQKPEQTNNPAETDRLLSKKRAKETYFPLSIMFRPHIGTAKDQPWHFSHISRTTCSCFHGA